MADALLPPPIDDPRSRAVIQLADRLNALPLDAALVYRIDGVPASALFPLAWQLAVEGLAGWDLATSEEMRRDLVRSAIARHRRKGTVGALRTALSMAGYDAAVIEEFVEGPFTFRVRPRALDEADQLPTEEQELLTGIISAWQNVRSHFVGLHFHTPPDTVDAVATEPADEPMQISQREYYFYDATHIHDGTITAGGSAIVEMGLV